MSKSNFRNFNLFIAVVTFLLWFLFSATCRAQLNFSPTSGPIGTTVTITGKPFSVVASQNVVRFGVVTANVMNATATMLTVTVPIGCIYSPVSVTVNNNTYYAATGFVVTFPACNNITSAAFSDHSYIAGNRQNIHMTTMDMDGDSKTDVLASTDQGLQIFTNSSSPGAFNFTVSPVIGVGDYSYAIGAADFDNDGKPDVVITGSQYHVKILKNNSSPGSILLNEVCDLPTGEDWYGIVVSNFDNDGSTDFALTNQYGGSSVRIYRNTTAAGIISFAPPVIYSANQWARDPAVADIDGDGKTDIIVPNQAAKNISVLRNTSIPGTISFASKVDVAMPANSSPESITVGDFDNDGKMDVAVANNNAAGNIYNGLGNVSVLRNTSTAGNILFEPRIDYPAGTLPFKVVATDLNGDGKIDLAVTNQLDARKILVLQNQGIASSLSFALFIEFPVSGALRPMAVSDLDGDGKPDIIANVDEASSSKMVVLKNSMGPGPTLTAGNILNPSCLLDNGSFDLSVIGGSQPYQFSVNGGTLHASGVFTQLPAGNYFALVKDVNGCTDTLSVALTQLGKPVVTAGITNATCSRNNGMINAAATGGQLPYSFSLNGSTFQASNSFVNLSSGIYPLYVKDVSGCVATSQVTIQNNCMTVTATTISATCGQNNGSISATVRNGTPPYLYSIGGIGFQSSGIFSNLSASTYTIIAKDAAGALSTTTVTITNIAALSITSVSTTPSDCSDTTGSMAIQTTGGTLPIQYEANNLLYQSSSTLMDLAHGTYLISARDANGCIADSKAVIGLTNNLFVQIARDSLSMCENETSVIQAVSNGNTFSWQPSSGVSDPTILNTTVIAKATAQYYLTASNGGCTSSDSILVRVNKTLVVNAGNDAWVRPGQAYQMQAVVTGPATSFLWTPSAGLSNPNTLNPMLMTGSSQTYTLTAAAGGKCFASDTVRINIITAILAPNAFSPNGDGINDNWVITNLLVYPKAVTEVYNRYGQLVYRAAGAFSWNGTMNGKDLPVGTYYYIIETHDGTGKIAGSVTIIR